MNYSSLLIFQFKDFKKEKLILFLLLFFTCSFSQQPAYFIFGEDQFKGLQIYNVIQDQELNYLFATNEGIFYYDFHNFKKLECDKAKGMSVFNFVMNKEGVIYCNNLNYQIFQIKGKECSLFYELSQDEGTPDISLSNGDDDNLIIGARKIIVLNKSGTAILSSSLLNHIIGPPFITNKKEVLFQMSNCDSALVYSNGSISKYQLRFSTAGSQTNSLLIFFSIKDSSYALDLKTKANYRFNQSKFELTLMPGNTLFERSEFGRIYETGNESWLGDALPGIVFLNNETIELKNRPYYEDYFISNVYVDHEGNRLLSTFDKGVLVVPDLEIPDVISPFRDDPVSSLYSDSVLGLVLGSSKGKLMNFLKGELGLLNEKGNRPLEVVYGNASSDWILLDNGNLSAYNKQTSKTVNLIEASLKDAVLVSGDTFYLGTNRGIFRTLQEKDGKFSTQIVNGFNQRIYAIEFNDADKNLYASTATGLFVISSSGSGEKVLLDNEDIFPGYLHSDGKKIYATTKKNGILVIENGKVVASILPVVNGKTESVKKIIVYQNTLIGKSSNGLFQFDMNGKLMKAIHSMFGFPAGRVMDFTFHGGQLWVSHSGGVQQIDLNYPKSKGIKPAIRFDGVFMNDEQVAFNLPGQFQPNKRKIKFVFSSPTLRNREAIRYHYRLIGYDNDWIISGPEGNEITYNALGPGNYTFQLKAELQGLYSDVVSYSFTIASPFYLRVWFIAACILLFLLVVYFFYRWQLNIQRRKSRQLFELNASKLTAIQSQMNPHFIFNALNSIQDLILKGDVEHSYSYITTFSNLVRRTLDYSDKDFIDFEQEIKLLELYLSLEKLRFKKSLNYEINFNKVDDILVPPLLIQPFIENALVHGLLHKEGEKILKISFELKEALICTIEDNGVGREKAKAIKQRQRADHESFSGKAIRNRFEILSNVFKGQFGYSYEDLVQNGEPCGTRVTLTIPIKYKF